MQHQKDWCIEQHHKTNHFYDSYLPYEFHLNMVANVAKDFLPKIFPAQVDLFSDTVLIACYGHDLIEDARCSYNDVKKELGGLVADIVYAVTNEKGKDRKEKANSKYYEGIRNTRLAVFVKLCDRIANVQYGKLTKSRMVDMYKKEQPNFEQQLYSSEYKPMFDYLNSLLNEQ